LVSDRGEAEGKSDLNLISPEFSREANVERDDNEKRKEKKYRLGRKWLEVIVRINGSKGKVKKDIRRYGNNKLEWG
jgi:hypothetical protein